MSEVTYENLRAFLDTLPTGYPKTPTGVEIRILKKLFTPEEAELCVKLKNEPEELSAIALRMGVDESELSPKLEQMAQKGLIFRTRSGDQPLYQAFQFMVGIYEFQLGNLDREFCEMFEEYLPFLGMSFTSFKTPQLRVIPVDAALKVSPKVETYNRVRELMKEHDLITVADCICRKEQGLLGKECDRPKETCIMFGDFAQYFLDNGMSRAISLEEAYQILDMAEAAGLVLQPSNTQKLASICCCCPCCCPGLKFSKMTPKPAKFVLSHYHAAIDADLCSSCGECVERCQMDAIKVAEECAEIIDGRCIGCGLCVSTCPGEAISLVPKPGMEAPPKDFRDTLHRIETERRAV